MQQNKHLDCPEQKVIVMLQSESQGEEALTKTSEIKNIERFEGAVAFGREESTQRNPARKAKEK